MSAQSTGARIAAAQGRAPADLLIKNCRALNVFTETFDRCDLLVQGGRFVRVDDSCALPPSAAARVIDAEGRALVPGFIDGHIHLESAVISPVEFARTVGRFGTAAVVVDPHEMANVLGCAGIDYILQATEGLPVDVYVMMPSCVPATPFDETGAALGAEEVRRYLGHPRVLGLAEMMNYPGLLAGDAGVLDKLACTAEAGGIIDGHAPGLSGAQLDAYVAAGVTSDHECTDLDEAREKLRRGQWIMIREGTACHNLEALAPLLHGPTAARCLFVCDDKHPGDLMADGHMDHIIRRAIALGVSPETAYKTASFTAAARFGLPWRGAIAPGYRADFVLLDDVSQVSVARVFHGGVEMTPRALADWPSPRIDGELAARVRCAVNVAPYTPAHFALSRTPEHVIRLVPHQILTEDGGLADGVDVARDIVKLCVVERHHATGHIGRALLSGYGLRAGAVATTVAHDSHNIIVAGADDGDIAFAVSRLVEMGGGMVVVCGGRVLSELALPIAGLMTDRSAAETAADIAALRAAARSLGVGGEGGEKEIDPFMTLSFAALPVIPALRLTTLGVFDVRRFALI